MRWSRRSTGSATSWARRRSPSPSRHGTRSRRCGRSASTTRRASASPVPVRSGACAPSATSRSARPTRLDAGDRRRVPPRRGIFLAPPQSLQLGPPVDPIDRNYHCYQYIQFALCSGNHHHSLHRETPHRRNEMAELKPAREGQRVPDVAFRVRQNGDWATITTADIFAGKNVVVFSLPGAFTPTCSSTHLPRYNELAPVFKAQGIDRIVCISVNDPFVMEEWGKDQEAENVLLIPDGNGEFTGKMGMLVDNSELNFGKRSWRYSMPVRDGTIEKMFVEPQEPGDPFKVSDADTMLHYINPNAKKPDQVAILTREGCSFCAKAKAQLAEAGI